MKAKYPREGLTKNLCVKQPTKSHNIKDVKKVPVYKKVTDPTIKKTAIQSASERFLKTVDR
jgi:hypothetical protein